jgi:isoleucyl-tRNA synthetase
MSEILESLVRLMAPILSFTSDEIWQYMKRTDRPLSVHADLFLPVNAGYKNAELESRWEKILTVRKEVLRALEIARREKKIGHPLDASVSLGLSNELMENLTPYEDQLRSIFIVSAVNMTEIDRLEGGVVSDALPGLKVSVSSSSDPKCERCWVHDPTVGHEGRHPTVCERCLQAMAEMGLDKE